jgi:hypothetical protein
MKRTLFNWILFSTAAAWGREQMTVAICNIGDLPTRAIEHAEAEAAYVFQTMGVEIHWTSCGAELDAENTEMRPDFIVRVRVGGQIRKTGPTSLETMGRAFMDADGGGDIVDVYYGAIQQLATRYPIADDDRVLGCTMAHELGHLLIGAGHRPTGIMRAAWSKGELEAIRHGYLKFNDAERSIILRNLRSRNAASPVRK